MEDKGWRLTLKTTGPSCPPTRALATNSHSNTHTHTTRFCRIYFQKVIRSPMQRRFVVCKRITLSMDKGRQFRQCRYPVDRRKRTVDAQRVTKCESRKTNESVMAQNVSKSF